MTLEELHINFRLELDKLEIASVPSFLPEEIDHFLNTSIERFIKTRYSGLNAHRDGFQQSQKRSDDLRTVTKTYSTSVFAITSNIDNTQYSISYPNDYWIGLGERVIVSIENGSTDVKKRVDVIEATIENVDSKLSNSLSEHRLHNMSAKPIRLYSDGVINLFTDNQYSIDSYSITYISKPDKLNWNFGPTNITITIMPDHTWDEITVNAVRYALENISENRYQTYAQESQVVE